MSVEAKSPHVTFADLPEYFWAKDDDERRRHFVFDRTGGELQIETMEKLVQWLKTGNVRPPSKLTSV